MKIGVFTDVHDNLKNLNYTLEYFERLSIGDIIFCGDFCSPIPAKRMGNFKGNIHCVFGNGDGDRFKILEFSLTQFNNLKVYGEHAEIELGQRKIAVTHYPLYATALARTGDYNAVFSGHTHSIQTEVFGDCLWLNPGDVLGLNGTATFAVYDTDTNKAEIIEIPKNI